MAENKGVIEAWVDRNGNKWWFPIVMTSLIFLEVGLYGSVVKLTMFYSIDEEIHSYTKLLLQQLLHVTSITNTNTLLIHNYGRRMYKHFGK